MNNFSILVWWFPVHLFEFSRVFWSWSFTQIYYRCRARSFRRSLLHGVFFSSHPLLRLTRIDLVHQQVPFLANHLLALGARLSNDLPNLDLQSADSAFVGPFVPQNGLLALRFLLSRIRLPR